MAKNSQAAEFNSKGYILTLTVALLAMLAPFSIDTYLPSFASMGDEFQISQEALQQSLSLYLIAFAATTLIYGSLSDSFGRRRVIIVALLFYIASSIGCFLAQDYSTFLLMRIGQGLSASGGMIVGRAVIRDRFEGAQARQAMSYVMLLFALAPAIAPMIGGLLQEWHGWRAVFIFLTILGGVTTLYTSQSLLPLAVSSSILSAHRSLSSTTLLSVVIASGSSLCRWWWA